MEIERLMPPPRPGDENPRPPGPEPLWADAWEIDFAAPAPAGDGAVGGFVRLALLPNLGLAWWWTSVLTPRLVAVRDHEVRLPRTGLEVRADGLWGELVCETPLEHWSVGLEAFGVAYDDPADAWGDEWGERLPIGLDLEWEATAGPGEALRPSGPRPEAGGDGWAHAGRVHGEILVGEDRIELAGTGFRSRSWGVLDWWSARRHRRRTWVDDQGRPHALDGGEDDRRVIGRAPVLVTAPGRQPVRLERTLCRFGHPTGAGFLGWAEDLPAEGS